MLIRCTRGPVSQLSLIMAIIIFWTSSHLTDCFRYIIISLSYFPWAVASADSEKDVSAASEGSVERIDLTIRFEAYDQSFLKVNVLWISSYYEVQFFELFSFFMRMFFDDFFILMRRRSYRIITRSRRRYVLEEEDSMLFYWCTEKVPGLITWRDLVIETYYQNMRVKSD